MRNAFLHKRTCQLWSAIVSDQIDVEYWDLNFLQAQGLGFPMTPCLGGVVIESPGPKWRRGQLPDFVSPEPRRFCSQSFMMKVHLYLFCRTPKFGVAILRGVGEINSQSLHFDPLTGVFKISPQLKFVISNVKKS